MHCRLVDENSNDYCSCSLTAFYHALVHQYISSLVRIFGSLCTTRHHVNAERHPRRRRSVCVCRGRPPYAAGHQLTTLGVRRRRRHVDDRSDRQLCRDPSSPSKISGLLRAWGAPANARSHSRLILRLDAETGGRC